MILNANVADDYRSSRRAPRGRGAIQPRGRQYGVTIPASGAPLEEKCEWMRRRMAAQREKERRARARHMIEVTKARRAAAC